jgi:hypothetical protein
MPGEILSGLDDELPQIRSFTSCSDSDRIGTRLCINICCALTPIFLVPRLNLGTSALGGSTSRGARYELLLFERGMTYASMSAKY